MPQIAGVFDSPVLANQAIASLLSAGLTKDDISLIMSDEAKKNFTTATKDAGDRAIVDGAIGAGAGGVLGALLSGLTAIGGLLIPGAQILVVGPVIAAFSGLGAGAAVGGIVGALSALEISTVAAKKYEEDIKLGKAVIVAHTKNSQQTLTARGILMNEGARINAA